MSEITQEQKEAFRNWLVENRENLVTIEVTKNSYITLDKTSVQEIQIVSREKRDCPRLWYNDGAYQDFPNHTKEELERIITT